MLISYIAGNATVRDKQTKIQMDSECTVSFSVFHQVDETRQHVLFVQISSFLEQKLNLTTCCAQMFSSSPPQTAPRCCIVVLIRTKVNARLLRKHSYRHCAIATAMLHKTKYSSPCKSALPYVTASNHLCCLSSQSFLTTCFMTN